MSQDASSTDHVLLLVSEPSLSAEVVAAIRAHLEDRPREVMVVAPALAGSALKHAMGDVDEARAEAQGVLEQSITQLKSEGVEAGGQVGDSDPLLALQDALQTFPADEIVIVTRPEDSSRWLEDNLFDRAEKSFEQPVIHLEVETSAADGGHVVAEEEKGTGVAPADVDTFDGGSRNTPRLTTRDTAGIIVAVLGSILAIVLAATSSGDDVQRDIGSGGEGSDGGAVFAYIVAGLITLINMAHVVGLLLFQAAEYRGGWAKMFSWMSLIGTPIAVILVLIAR
jgi:hypothetical protein